MTAPTSWKRATALSRWEFSPNYESDGTIMIVAVDLAGSGLCRTTYVTCENRSENAGAFADSNEVSIVDAVQSSAVIAFPDDYNAATNNNYYVATVGGGDTVGGSVFRRTAGAWEDENPCGASVTPGCPTTSLVSNGNFSDGTVIAGMRAVSSNESQIFRSTTGGKTWSSSAIKLGGESGHVKLGISTNYATDSTVYAATTGVAGAFHTSTTGGGTAGGYVAQGLFADTYDTIFGIDGDPADGNPLFMVYGAGGTRGAVFKTTAGTSTAARWTRTGLIAGGGRHQRARLP